MQDYNHRRYQSRVRAKQPFKPSILIWILVIPLGVGLIFLLKNQLFTPPILVPQVYELGAVTSKQVVSLFEPEESGDKQEIIYNSTDEVITAIDGLVQGKQGTYGWYVQSLLTGESYGRNDNFTFTAASVNKVPILVSYLHGVEQGRFSLSDIYRLKEEDKEEGTGSIQYQENGKPYTFEELVMAMGKHSDNTATNAIAKRVGKTQIQAFVDSRQMLHTSIADNKTSPKDMGELFSNIYLDFLFQDKRLKNVFTTALSDTDYETRIPQGVPEDVVVVHKIGNQIQVWNDCGLVLGPNPYSVCILTDGIKLSEAQDLLPKMSRAIWNYESRRS